MCGAVAFSQRVLDKRVGPKKDVFWGCVCVFLRVFRPGRNWEQGKAGRGSSSSSSFLLLSFFLSTCSHTTLVWTTVFFSSLLLFKCFLSLSSVCWIPPTPIIPRVRVRISIRKCRFLDIHQRALLLLFSLSPVVVVVGSFGAYISYCAVDGNARG